MLFGGENAQVDRVIPVSCKIVELRTKRGPMLVRASGCGKVRYILVVGPPAQTTKNGFGTL